MQMIQEIKLLRVRNKLSTTNKKFASPHFLYSFFGTALPPSHNLSVVPTSRQRIFLPHVFQIPKATSTNTTSKVYKPNFVETHLLISKIKSPRSTSSPFYELQNKHTLIRFLIRIDLRIPHRFIRSDQLCNRLVTRHTFLIISFYNLPFLIDEFGN